MSNVTLTGSICLTVFFIYCVCLFPFAKFLFFFHLCCATTYVGEIKLLESVCNAVDSGLRGHARLLRR